MFGCRPSAFSSSMQAMPLAPAPLHHQLGLLDVAAGQMQRIDQAGRRDDRGAVLVVVEHRNVEQLAQPLLDDEALGRLDVFEVDAAPALAEELDAVDELVRILGVHFEIDGVDIGEALEQHRLAFHHGLGGERAAIAEPEDRGAVGDDGDEIALGGVVVGAGSHPRRSPAPARRRRANRRARDRAASPSAWWRSTSSLPGRPWLWNSSASWSVNVGRDWRLGFFVSISTP